MRNIENKHVSENNHVVRFVLFLIEEVAVRDNILFVNLETALYIS